MLLTLNIDNFLHTPWKDVRYSAFSSLLETLKKHPENSEEQVRQLFNKLKEATNIEASLRDYIIRAAHHGGYKDIGYNISISQRLVKQKSLVEDPEVAFTQMLEVSLAALEIGQSGLSEARQLARMLQSTESFNALHIANQYFPIIQQQVLQRTQAENIYFLLSLTLEDDAPEEIVQLRKWFSRVKPDSRLANQVVIHEDKGRMLFGGRPCLFDNDRIEALKIRIREQ